MLALTLPSLAAFVMFELHLQHRGRSPLVTMRLFLNLAFSLGLVMVLTFFAGLAAFFMGLTIFLQQEFGYGPLAMGIEFVGFGIGFMGASLLSSRVSRRIGPLAISLGSGMMVAGLLAMIVMANAAHGAAINLVVLWPVLI